MRCVPEFLARGVCLRRCISDLIMDEIQFLHHVMQFSKCDQGDGDRRVQCPGNRSGEDGRWAQRERARLQVGLEVSLRLVALHPVHRKRAENMSGCGARILDACEPARQPCSACLPGLCRSLSMSVKMEEGGGVLLWV